MSANVGVAPASGPGGVQLNRTTGTSASNPNLADHDLNNESWLWVYAAARGDRNETRDNIQFYNYGNGNYRNLEAKQYAEQQYGVHKGVFNYMFGSWVGDWDSRRSLLRSAVADPDGYGLTAAWGNRPVWNVHHMGLGEPIGVSLLKSQNDFGPRQTYGYDIPGSTDLSLIGDPTLRQDVVTPPLQVFAAPDPASDAVSVKWVAPYEQGVVGYRVYRAASADGPFVRVSGPNPLTGKTFTDPAGGDHSVYMVRTEKLETTPSGSYYNLSRGTFSSRMLADARFNYATAPQSVTLTFLNDPGASLDQGDLTIQDVNTKAAVTQWSLGNYNAATRQATLTFTGTRDGFTGSGILPDGHYRLTISGTGVTGSSGRPMGADSTFDFFFLAGDADNSGGVNLTDFQIMKDHLGQTGGPYNGITFATGDFNYDGKVDGADFKLLLDNFGKHYS